MASQPAEDHIETFALELVCTGVMLGELVSDLSAALPADAYPGEEPRAVVMEMLCGTIGTALQTVDLSAVERATELIKRAAARTLEHLRLARELSQRIHGEDGGVGRTYG
jgi:hypothetical protein